MIDIDFSLNFNILLHVILGIGIWHLSDMIIYYFDRKLYKYFTKKGKYKIARWFQ